MKNNFRESLSKIDIPAGRKDAILDNILFAADSIRRGEKKENYLMKNIWKFALAGAGLAACIALAVMAVPALTAQPLPAKNTIAVIESPKVSDIRPAAAAFELSAKYSDSQQYIKLALSNNGGNIGARYTIPSDFFSFNENGVFNVCSAMDFMVENADAAKVIFESKNYDLDYEDSRNWVTDDKMPTWSDCIITFNLVDLGGKRDFSRSEVIAVLENIQKSSDQKYKAELMKLADRLYISEEEEVINKGGDPNKFLEEKMSEPIDFDRYLAEYKVENDNLKGFDDEYLVIKFVNPDNQPIPRVIGKKVETRPGEIVVWAPDGDKLVGKHREEIDYTSITDEITVTVVYADGSRQKQVWMIGFSENGKAELFCADVSGSAA